jgi:hypothetical protein
MAQAAFSGKLPSRKPKNIDMCQREYLTNNRWQTRTNPCPAQTLRDARRPDGVRPRGST